VSRGGLLFSVSEPPETVILFMAPRTRERKEKPPGGKGRRRYSGSSYEGERTTKG